MEIETDLDFFPTLRDISCTPDMIALKTRNDKRLAAAKLTDGNVYRTPQNCENCGSWFWGFTVFRYGVCQVCEDN